MEVAGYKDIQRNIDVEATAFFRDRGRGWFIVVRFERKETVDKGKKHRNARKKKKVHKKKNKPLAGH